MATQYAIPEELTRMWGGAKDWLSDLFQKGFDPNQNTQPPLIPGYEAERPKSAGEQMSGILMPETPKSAYESGVMGMGPMPIFTKNELTDKLLGSLKPQIESGLTTYGKGWPKLGENLESFRGDIYSGKLGNSLEEMLGRLNPNSYKNIKMRESGNISLMGMETAKYPGSFGGRLEHSLLYDPKSITRRVMNLGNVDNAIPFMVGHEIGHKAFRNPHEDMFKAGIRAIVPPTTNIVGTNMGRFDSTLKNLEGTNLNNIFRMIEQNDPKIRAKYWRVGFPERLPQEEYYADAIGAKAAGLQEADKFPIDWSYFEGLFK